MPWLTPAGAARQGQPMSSGLSNVAQLEFSLLCRKADYRSEPIPSGLTAAQADLLWADHLLIVYPLWAGKMPALLKGFIEQVSHPEMVEPACESEGGWSKPLLGKSARVVVAMGKAV